MHLRLALSCLTLALAAAACDPGPQAVPVGAAARPAVEPRPAPTAEVALAVADTGADQDGAEAALRAQLLGLNRPKPAPEGEGADQVEPEQAAKATEASARRRAPRRSADSTVRPLPLTPEAPSGGLSDGEFQAAVGSWRGVQSCLVENAGHVQERSGAMQVSFQIDAAGAVSDWKVLDTTTQVAQLIAPCVERKARRIRFPATPGAETTKVAKFVF